MDIMAKRQTRALTNLEKEVAQAQLQEHKVNDDPSSDEEDSNQTKKRQRGDDQTTLEQSTFPACTYCQHYYEPELMERHQDRCPKRPKPLKPTLLQTTIAFSK
jgi:hypothetical protein